MIFFLSFIATGNVKSLKWLKSLVACLSATDCWQLLTRQLSNCKCAQIAMTIYSSLFRLSSLSCIYLQVFACHRLFFYFLLSSKVCYSFINIDERDSISNYQTFHSFTFDKNEFIAAPYLFSDCRRYNGWAQIHMKWIG